MRSRGRADDLQIRAERADDLRYSRHSVSDLCACVGIPITTEPCSLSSCCGKTREEVYRRDVFNNQAQHRAAHNVPVPLPPHTLHTTGRAWVGSKRSSHLWLQFGVFTSVAAFRRKDAMAFIRFASIQTTDCCEQRFVITKRKAEIQSSSCEWTRGEGERVPKISTRERLLTGTALDLESAC